MFFSVLMQTKRRVTIGACGGELLCAHEETYRISVTQGSVNESKYKFLAQE